MNADRGLKATVAPSEAALESTIDEPSLRLVALVTLLFGLAEAGHHPRSATRTTLPRIPFFQPEPVDAHGTHR